MNQPHKLAVLQTALQHIAGDSTNEVAQKIASDALKEANQKVAVRHKSTEHQEMYFHVRVEDERFSGGTVFARLEAEGWVAVAAICNKLDQFDRARGRTIARRRLFNRTHVDWQDQEKPTYADAQKIVFDRIIALKKNHYERP